MSLTPIHLQILLCAARNEWEDATARMSDYTKILFHEGLIEEPIPNRYLLTERGKAYVEALCALPLPVCKWAMPAWWSPSA